MESKATLRMLRIAPRKAREVADMVRGKKVDAALAHLSVLPRRSAKPISDLIKSAMANADQKGKIDVDTLYIQTITVDAGRTLKRYRPVPMGRAAPILKRTSHITVVLAER